MAGCEATVCLVVVVTAGGMVDSGLPQETALVFICQPLGAATRGKGIARDGRRVPAIQTATNSNTTAPSATQKL